MINNISDEEQSQLDAIDLANAELDLANAALDAERAAKGLYGDPR